MTSSGSSSKSANVLLKELTAAFSRLKNIESTQQRHSDDIRIARQILCRFINEHLINLDKVYFEISKATGTGGTPHCMVIIDLLALCTSQFPAIFSSGSPQITDDTPGLSQLCRNLTLPQDAEYYICQGLTTWVTCQLLRLLSDDGCTVVHEKLLDIIISLFQLVKNKDLPMFHYLISQLIDLMAELCQLNAKHFDSGAVETIDNPIKLKYFSLSDKLSDIKEVNDFHKEMMIEPISIQFYCQLHLLQLATSSIVKEMLRDIVMCANDKLMLLWLSLNCQIEDGQNKVKQLSMEVISKLWKISGKPSEQVVDYLMELLSSLMVLLFSDCDEPLGDIILFEKSLSKCLNVIFEVTTKPVHHLSALHITGILDSLVQGLTTYGLSKLKTVELKFSVCHVLHYIYTYVTAGYESDVATRLERTQSVNNALIDHIGKDTNSQYLVGVLYQTIENDLQLNKHKAAADSVKSTIDMTQPSDGDYKSSKTETSGSTLILKSSDGEDVPEKKKKLSLHRAATKRQQLHVQTTSESSSTEDETSTSSFLTEKSTTYSSLMLHLSSLCNHLSSSGDIQSNDQTIHDLEGIRVILEVMSHCNYIITDKILNITSVKRKSPVTPSTRNRQPRDKNVMWLTGQQCRHLSNIWMRILHHLPSTVSHTYCTEVYKRIVHGIGALLTMKETIRIPSDVLHTVSWILSLPWLQMEATWMDLKPSHLSPQDVAALSASLADKIDPTVQAEAVKIMCLVPKEIASKWRTHVIKAAMGGSVDVVRLAIIQSFAVLLYTLGINSHHLIRDHLHDLVKDSNADILKEIAKVIGPISIVLSRHATLQSSEPLQFKAPLHTSLSVVSVLESPQPTLSQFNLQPLLFVPFLHLLSVDNVDIKLAFIQSLHSIFPYLDLTSSNSADMNIITTCLELCVEPSYQVRSAFSRVVPQMVAQSGDSSTNKAVMALVTRLKTAFVTAKAQGNARLQETVVLTIGQIGKVAEGELLLLVIICLLDSMIFQPRIVTAAAFTEIQAVARYKSLKLSDLFNLYKQQICKFVVDSVHEQPSGGNKEIITVFTEVSKVFEFKTYRVFLSSTLKFTLPYLINKATSSASMVLKLIAKTLDMDFRHMLVENFRFIFSYLVRSCQRENLQKALTYVENQTEIELSSLLRSDYQNLHNELLLHISTSYPQVFSGLAMLASQDETKPQNITTAEAMSDFLQPRLLGILAFFDNQLQTSSIGIQEKKLALESLVSVMKLMGPKHITAVRVKVMTTLKIGLRYKDSGFPELNCTAWDCLVHSVELSSLGPMLSQIIVTLLPLLHQLPDKVAAIYRYLIVENREVLNDHFHEVYFIPDIPELAEVNSVLQECRQDSAITDLCTQLKQALQHVSHESLDVRIYALTKLKHLLHNNQMELSELILGNENIHPVISQLVSVILAGCRESDPNARNMFGECLGELGAIDPGRLDLITNNKSEDINRFQAAVEDINFAYDLISELARAFLAAADPRVQDCSAYAIQESLNIYECHDGKKECYGRRLWRRFPEPTQEILKPHLHTRYVPAASSNWSGLIKPIYRSKKGKSFKDWVCTWTGYLLTKIKQEKPSRVFKACSMIIKHDTQTALFLLPHVVIYALLDGTPDENQEICTEILAVLTHAEKLDEQQEGDFCHMSSQTVFSILDHLTKWTRHKLNTMVTSRIVKKGSFPDHEDDPQYKKVKCFLEKIPQDVLAKASFNCKAYTRSLMHFEAFITNKKQDIQQHLGFMQKLYVMMDEPDGVAGVSAIRQENPSLHEQILEHESTGQLRDASACYERAIQLESDDVSHHQGLLKSLMNLGQLSTALIHVNGVLADRTEWTTDLNSYRVEASWKLGQWDSLENYLKIEQSSNWYVGLGKILLAAKKNDEQEFRLRLKTVRNEQMGPLSAASMENGSYQRGYEYIVRLHMLNEIERGVKCLVGLKSDDHDEYKDSQHQILTNWQSRLDIIQPSFRTQEPILCLRRVILGLVEDDASNSNKDIGQCWLQSARIARKDGHVQTAYSSLLNASAYSMSQFCLEKAKWLWSKGDLHQALITLQKGVEDNFNEDRRIRLSHDTEAIRSERFTHAKALLLVGRFMEETAKFESNSVMRQYKEVISVHKEWEDGHFYLAKYYDKLMSTVADRPEKHGEIVLYIMKHFGNSLQYGNQYIYQSMPRLLSLWLDFGAKVSEQEKSRKSEKVSNKTVLGHLNKMIADHCERLAPYQYLTAFSQLISRICHSHAQVFQQLKEIIAKLLVVFPQQAVWMMMAVNKSTYAMRTKRCRDIFSRAIEMNADLEKFIHHATKLQDRLLEVCNHAVESSCDKLSMGMHFKPLKRMVEDEKFSPIIVPLQIAMTVTLPSTPGIHTNHNPFPCAEVYIAEFDDQIEVLPSLQKPKKIGIRGTDGKLYFMMCKPKDDLRKDCRLMEFNAVVNKCLKKDAESRKRQLHIRTYAVVPLNEECGLIEWVPNTEGLRHILHRIYKARNMYVSGRDLKSMTAPNSSSIETKLNIFKTRLLPRFPPVFHEWFLKTFPDPTSWYMARLSYCRTSSVMSIVGYILGLGDRHGENILFDSTNGDTVHVDFNCLFNKGETFDCPEIVPFRMTHNMTEAMGPMGHEGIFRRSCEVTMKVMRDQTDPLMSVLKTFIYDPLVEWSKPSKNRASMLAESGEINNEKAMTHVKDIEQRLQGILKNKNKSRGLPLSVEGHTHYLIQEAVAEKNLCQMYIGWAAYL